MKLHENYSLINRNTFRMNVSCRYFAEVENTDELKNILSDKKFKYLPKLILGEGSNILFTKDFDGFVLTQTSNKIEIIAQSEKFGYVTADAGVNWHDLVLFCVEKNLGGIENLSLIPGKAGAAPIQNIGAYGQELKDIFYSLRGFYLEDLTEAEMMNIDCKFDYRDSIFKRELKDKFVITSITLQLNTNPKPNTNYWAVKEELGKLNKSEFTIKDVSKIVCKIRQSKLPDPKVIGNAGSFFKNPEITAVEYLDLKREYPDMPGFSLPNKLVKVPAAWLIERCGLKGKRFGNVGVHEKQALVIVNYGGASPQEIIDLSELIKHHVRKNFKIELEEEVTLI